MGSIEPNVICEFVKIHACLESILQILRREFLLIAKLI